MSPDVLIRKSPPLQLRMHGAALPFPFDSANAHLTRNGRFAIREGLRALELPKGAAVLLPAWHCGSEADAVLAAGLQVALYRLNPDLSADLENVAQQLAKGGIAAVYAIHYFGYGQPAEALLELARAHGAVLIEDVALGLFSCTQNAVPLGSQGDMSVFSLVKTLPLPEGGALWLRKPQPRALARLQPPPLRAVLAGFKGVMRRTLAASAPAIASSPDPRQLECWHSRAGITPMDMGGRMSLLTRLLLRGTDAAAVKAAHRRNYETLQASVPRRAGMRPLLPDLPVGACPAFFPLFTPDADRVHHRLQAAGIQSVRFWRQFHPAVDLTEHPGAQDLKRSVLRLPVHAGLVPADMQRICEALHQAVA
ncbi:DegT/DnrJ/EryC1/StrS family aminotransferase [Leisingera sp. ANG-Vp]|uniref:DegT/DnrJ/EryC1/StrS family aminotransferase n=1 Tax=Leisingera sp. ANG-Vp TaxID=1577896 RepID=UPI00057F5EBB|nr:DegT/DnrJ/EryC1/StrS family aminotransferase [Leisingera sp. ANG-Vp]KIC16249.1 hypothetical protein RA20_16830 [Leisingera sp. ANG-Vp]